MPCRTTLHRDLAAIEHATGDVLDRAAAALAGAADPAGRSGGEPRDDAGLHADCLDIVRLLACQAPVAGDLRLVTSLLAALKHAERIGNQVAEIERLTAHDDEAVRTPVVEDLVGRMRTIAGAQVVAARHALLLRDAGLARAVEERDHGLNVLNREVFRRAVELGDTLDARAWLIAATLVARALERVGDNAVGIARLVPGLTGEPTRGVRVAPPA
ncbi:unannotated protein [freshwater metagenome]|uniref:Unannotated protein n=1 Tax=freshwater metagenome TaxID=449393 RepID=A0A6J7FTE5_9ZZZZ|nr:PhoU family transcriptional regulator [Actinomycetota bacterium]